MLLNWHTIDACFLSSSFHIKTPFTFFFACLASFFLVISLEFFRRCQRNFDRYLRLKIEFLQEQENAYVMPDVMEEKLLDKGSGEGLPSQKVRSRTVVVVLEQLSRGVFHGCQFTVSYSCYCSCTAMVRIFGDHLLLRLGSLNSVLNVVGYIMMSIIFGAVVGFVLFTRDSLYPSAYP